VQLNGGGGLLGLVFSLVGAVGGLLGWLLGLLGLGGGAASSNSVQPIPDPIRYLADPDPVKLALPQRSTTNLLVTSGTVDLYPGIYTGGITVKLGAQVILHANSDGTPGIYYLQGGGFKVSGTSTGVTTAATETAGVMIYNDWSIGTDVVNLSGGGSLTITTPSSGAYEGISIFQKRGTLSTPAPAITIAGNGTTNMRGAIYAAYAQVNLSSKSGTNVLGGQIIADTLTVTGSSTVNIDPGTQPIASTRLLGLVQ
jgi:hypothetical protein